MTVHETWNHYAAGGVDLFARAYLRQVLHAPRQTDLDDPSMVDEQRAIVNNTKFLERGAAPGPG
jgi:hypothetical protein